MVVDTSFRQEKIFVQLINGIRVLSGNKIIERDSYLCDGRQLDASVSRARATGRPVEDGATKQGSGEVG